MALLLTACLPGRGCGLVPDTPANRDRLAVIAAEVAGLIARGIMPDVPG